MDLSQYGVGSETAAAISSAVASGRLPHAVMLEGGSESARLALAKQLAKACVCLAEAGRPCGKCGGCLKSEAGFHPDVSFLLCGEDKDAHKIDAVRRMRNEAYVLPNEADKRVFIINNAQLMNEPAQNALLKILEEPPRMVCFILTCDTRFAVLSTVLSRCTVYSLETQNSQDISRAGEAANELALALTTNNEFELMRATAVFEKNRELMRPALYELCGILRDAVVKRTGAGIPCGGEAARKLATAFSSDRLLDMITAAKQIDSALDRNANQTLNITRLCSTLRAASGR